MNSRTPIATNAAPAAIGAYSQAIRAGDLVFTAGQVGADPASGELVEGVAAQADRALRNLSAILDAAGTSLERVVKTTIFLVDMGDWATVNEAYAAHFSPPFPARSTVGIKALPKGALVEIEAVAMAGERG
ncbi:MAG TPA: RidA family protein [Candidatus Dormibacteraeota bacterium]|jgi:2-iminobutanoate/2-iminopropanoate deaminase|nr:RidA family protein [Candidatus Dormibacteraeota bacterium]